ncbi:MAG: arylesterase [Pseudomonadota bacterium]
MGKVLATIVMLVWGTTLRSDEIVIAALGDSLTQGYGLPIEQGFVPQLQAWLQNAGTPARLINAGVSGDTTAGGLSRIAWTLTPDVDALIVTLGGNDLLRGLPPEESRANLEGIVAQAQEADVKVLLIGMRAPGNYGPDYKQAFDQMYPDIAQTYDTLYLDSFFAGWGGTEADPSSARDLLQPDGIHPNAQGVARIVEGVGPVVQTLISRVQ